MELTLSWYSVERDIEEDNVNQGTVTLRRYWINTNIGFKDDNQGTELER